MNGQDTGGLVVLILGQLGPRIFASLSSGVSPLVDYPFNLGQGCTANERGGNDLQGPAGSLQGPTLSPPHHTAYHHHQLDAPSVSLIWQAVSDGVLQYEPQIRVTSEASLTSSSGNFISSSCNRRGFDQASPGLDSTGDCFSALRSTFYSP